MQCSDQMMKLVCGACSWPLCTLAGGRVIVRCDRHHAKVLGEYSNRANTVPQICRFRRYSRASISTAFLSGGFDSSDVMLRRRPATVATNDLRAAAPTAADSEAVTASVPVGKCCACTHACSLRNGQRVQQINQAAQNDARVH